MTSYYRTQRGFEGKRYRVHVPESDLKGLILILLIDAAIAAILSGFLGFLLGLSVARG